MCSFLVGTGSLSKHRILFWGICLLIWQQELGSAKLDKFDCFPWKFPVPRWAGLFIKSSIALRELHSYFSGAQWPYLSKSVYEWVRDRCHQTRSPPISLYKGINALCWPSTIRNWQVTPYTIPVLLSTNQYRLTLTQYHQVPTIAVPYWPSTQLHHLVTHSWANWAQFARVLQLSF